MATGQEEVMAHWVDASDAHSGHGVTCSSDYDYAYDATAGRLRLTVLRSPRYADHGRPWVSDDVIDQPATDQGWHEVSYRLRRHLGREAAFEASRQAEEHVTRYPVVAETWHRGPLGGSSSAVAVTPAQVSLAALKRAEDGGGWVLRLCEMAGRPTPAHVELTWLQRRWDGDLGAFEVTTLFVPDDPGDAVTEVAISEMDLSAR
jgi:alpha-mannosidase